MATLWKLLACVLLLAGMALNLPGCAQDDEGPASPSMEPTATTAPARTGGG